MRATRIAVASTLALLGIVSGSPVWAQSFNCRTAEQPDEILICQRPELSALDEQMSSLFFRLRNSLGGSARARLVADQKDWLAGRIGCGRDFGCIRDAYEQRIRELRQY